MNFENSSKTIFAHTRFFEQNGRILILPKFSSFLFCAYTLISSQHNAVRGHAGVDITLYRLRKGGYTFPNLELKVRTFIRKCPFCQLMSQIKPLVKAKKFTTVALYPFQVICSVVMMCAFLRWIELFQLRPQLQKNLQSYPSDNGPPFANDLLKGLANLLGSTNEFTTAYSSEDNGIVERANKEVLRHL